MTRKRSLPTVFAALALATVALGLAACGSSSDSNNVNEGEPVRLGELSFNVTFSRYLNPADSEDAAYLEGQPEPPKGQSYFGVFFEIQNESEEPQKLPTEMTITDAEDNVFKPVESESDFALELGGEVPAGEQIPVLDTPAQQGPIEGSVLIVLLPEEASSNRPLELHIPGPEGEKGKVTLDL